MKYSQLRITPPFLLSALLCLCGALAAQTFRGGIGGTITDAQQAMVPNASVQATEDSTGQSRFTVSSSAGIFVFQDLPQGTYTVTIQAAGFDTLKMEKIIASAGSVRSLQLALAVAQQSQTLEVSASALSLDTVSATQNTVVPEAGIEDAPLNGTDFTQLVALAPGYTGYSANGTNGSLNGTRINQVNWQIDGVDNNDAWHNIPAVNQSGVSGIAGNLLPLDAVESFSLQTQFAPEAGRNSGGTVNLGLRSGTNQLHGSLYFFDRNEFFAAKSPFTSTKQEVRNYNAGGSVGGPIIHDKLFSFGAIEKQSFVIGVPAESTMPSVAYHTQALALLAEHGVPVDSATQNLLKTLWPTDALTGPAATNNYTSSAPETGYSYNGVFKVDYNINSRNSISFHWFSGEGRQAAPVGSNLQWYYQVAPTHVQNYAVVANSQIAPTVGNQVLLGVNYFKQSYSDVNSAFDPISLGFNTGAPVSGAPTIKLGSSSQLSQVGLTPPLSRDDVTGHVTDALTWTTGPHQIRVGGEYRRVLVDKAYHSNQRGTFIFNGAGGPWAANPTSTDLAADHNTLILADFLAGYLARGTISRGDQARTVDVNTLSFSAQDAWQVRPRFTLNYGVRYDYEGAPYNSDKNLSVFLPGSGIVFQGAGIGSVYPAVHTDFSPRLGFSYQPKSGGGTVIRGGIGLYYDTPNLNTLLSQNPGNGGAIGLQGNPAGPSPVLTLSIPKQVIVPGQLLAPTSANPATSCIVTASTLSPCGLFSVSRDFKTPHNLNYSLNVQQALGHKLVAQIGYVGSQARHLVLLRDINQPALSSDGVDVDSLAQQKSRPYYSAYPNYGAINQLGTTGIANYNSLQVVLRTQSWRGLTTQASYTWGHNLDDGAQYRSVLPQDSTNIKGDYGNSDYDVRHTFSAYVNYAIPGLTKGPRWLSHGWQLNAVLSIHSGEPFSVLSSNDNSGTGEGYQRAVEVNNPFANVPSGFWINPASFTDGPTGTFQGTSGRTSLFGPSYQSADFSVFKSGTIHEVVKVEFRAELFNLFNHTNYASPLNVADGSSLGQLYDTVGDYNGAPGIGPGEPLNAQLGLKLHF